MKTIKWERTETETKDGSVVVTRFGHQYLAEGYYETVLCPETFQMLFVSGKIPVTQGFRAIDGKDSILTPVIVDVKELKKGNYDYFALSQEEVTDLRKNAKNNKCMHKKTYKSTTPDGTLTKCTDCNLTLQINHLEGK